MDVKGYKEGDVQYDCVKKHVPKVHETTQSTVNTCTRIELNDFYADSTQTCGGSGEYNCQSKSSETATSCHNMDVQIKEEPTTGETCNVTDSIQQLCDFQNDNSVEKNLNSYRESSNSMTYAVCIKYEPNPYEEDKSYMMRGSRVSLRKPFDKTNDNICTVDNSHCNEKCSHASDDVLNRDVQESCGFIKCETHEPNIQKDSTEQSVPGRLAEHKRKHQGKQPYKCSVRNNRTCRSNELATQKEKLTDIKQYKNDVPGYCSTTSSSVTKRKRKHTTDKQHECDICSYIATRPSHLVLHKRKHSGEKPFKCDICNYSTARSHNLAAHKGKHTSEKPYKCDVCNYSTIYASDRFSCS